MTLSVSVPSLRLAINPNTVNRINYILVNIVFFWDMYPHIDICSIIIAKNDG